ncbi:MAG: ABC transporter permease [Acidimicrobiia bacterium]|nr:ABC transporter permease [Acidimicrobiia bacterium]
MRLAWRAELLKIATVRGQWLGAAIATLALPAISLLVAATGGVGAGDTVTSGAATGSVAGLLAFGVWAATLAAGEYAQQTMIVSLTTVPRRSVLYGAKLAAIGCVAVVGALVSVVTAWLVVWAVLPSGVHHLGDPAALVSVVFAISAVSVLGMAVGLMTRSPSASASIVVVAVLLPKAAGGLLGGLQRWVVGASPGTVVTQAVGGAQLPHNQMFPGGAAAATVTMLLVATVVAVGGAVTLVRRDG